MWYFIFYVHIHTQTKVLHKNIGMQVSGRWFAPAVLQAVHNTNSRFLLFWVYIRTWFVSPFHYEGFYIINKICKLYKWSKKNKSLNGREFGFEKIKEKTHRLYTFVNEIIKIENIHGNI